tara:strand:+ start:9879 stop:10685 length:807 start_codon:yes stop_codon:yes gene_type:complete
MSTEYHLVNTYFSFVSFYYIYVDTNPIIMKKILPFLVSILFFTNNFSQPPGWSDGFIPLGFDNHIVAIQSNATIIIDNGTISSGDFIGAFYDSSGVYKCGGFSEWTGNTIAVTVWADDIFDPGKLGFDQDEHMNWKIWRASDSVTIDVTARYNINSNTPDSAFITNGLSEITLLQGNTTPSSIANFNSYELNMFPNPTNNDFLNISSSTDSPINSICIYNLAGELISSYDNLYTKEKIINISTLSSGNYIIRIKNEISEISKKLVIYR